MGNINKANEALSRTKEVAMVGSRSNRSIFRTLAAAGVALGIGVIAGNSFINNSSVADQNSMVSSSVEQATARVVGKVFQPAGGVLGETFEVDGAPSWQPEKDAVGSKYRLVLALDGELNTATVAVTPDVYNQYCKQAIFIPQNRIFSDPRDPSFAGCGQIYDKDPATPEGHIPLDEVNISFTRNLSTGEIQVTELEGAPKAASSFTELLQLRKAFKDQYKQSQAPEMGVRVRTATLG